MPTLFVILESPTGKFQTNIKIAIEGLRSQLVDLLGPALVNERGDGEDECLAIARSKEYIYQTPWLEPLSLRRLQTPRNAHFLYLRLLLSSSSSCFEPRPPVLLSSCLGLPFRLTHIVVEYTFLN